MASLAGAITTLGLAGVPFAAPVFDSEYHTTPRPYTQTFTQLGLDGCAVLRHTSFSHTETTTAEVNVSDTASISATESPVDTQEIAVTDTARLSVTDSSQLFNFLAATETAGLSLSETISLVIVGVTTKTGSDTASLTLTESTSVAVTIEVTDTASLTLTETPTVDVSTEQKTATDTASITLDEAVSLNVFSGVNTIAVGDAALLSIVESSSVIEVRRIKRIALSISRPYIELEIL